MIMHWAVSKKIFDSTNGFPTGIKNVASLFWSFYASDLQHKNPETNFPSLTKQLHILRKLKMIGTTVQYRRPSDAS